MRATLGQLLKGAGGAIRTFCEGAAVPSMVGALKLTRRGSGPLMCQRMRNLNLRARRREVAPTTLRCQTLTGWGSFPDVGPFR